MTAVIEVEGLCKQYRRWRGGPTVAVERLDISVPAGGVFGFSIPVAGSKANWLTLSLPSVGTSTWRLEASAMMACALG